MNCYGYSTRPLVDFLFARIAEDEEVAREATDDGMNASIWREGRRGGCGCCLRVTGLGVDIDDRQAAHVARHDPARVRAECEAKRRIVTAAHHVYVQTSPDAVILHGFVLRALALPYADHPDYQSEWRP